MSIIITVLMVIIIFILIDINSKLPRRDPTKDAVNMALKRDKERRDKERRGEK